MTDKEKVVNGLKCCLHDEDDDHGRLCEECPYDHGDCRKDLYNDVFILLKKQEPKPVKNIDDSEVGIRSGFCPECQKLIYYNILHPAEFCKYCGQAVKWDEG